MRGEWNKISHMGEVGIYYGRGIKRGWYRIKFYFFNSFKHINISLFPMLFIYGRTTGNKLITVRFQFLCLGIEFEISIFERSKKA